MSSANFASPLVVQSPGNIIYSASWNAEFANIKANCNPDGLAAYQDDLATKHAQSDPAAGLASSLAVELEQLRFVIARLAGTTNWDDEPDAVATDLVPVGSIMAFYDFNGLVTFNTDNWVYCDGTVLSDAASPLNGQTLPDLSGRYLVGFGTDGGGDIDSAAWATAAVGNTSHQIDIAHTHTGPNHSHGVGSYQFKTFEIVQTVGYLHSWKGYNSGGTAIEIWKASTSGGGTATDEGLTVMTNFGNTTVPFYTASGTGTSASDGTGATGSSLSSTQSIQPRSLRVRFIMRKR